MRKRILIMGLLPVLNAYAECDEEGYLCKICDDGYFLDANGGCSYTNNCEISEKGHCFKLIQKYL